MARPNKLTTHAQEHQVYLGFFPICYEKENNNLNNNMILKI